VLKLFRSREKSRLLFIVLYSIIGAIITVIVIGTIIGLSHSKNSKSNVSLEAPTDDTRVFAGIGRLRIPLSNSSSTMILSIAFPYSAADVTFTEELAGKIGDFRTIASGYFSSLPQESLINIDEEAAKTEILRRYNAILRLGRIQALYFSDLMIIDETQ